nr:ATP-binding protein [Pyrobaculum aerophilum]
MDVVDRSNPWWFSPRWEEEDKHLRQWQRERVKWVPEWIWELGLEPPALNFVYGPRQTGKTTGLKLLVRELLKRIEPDSVAYLDLDIILSPAELRRAFEYVVGRAARRGVKRLFILLDEVTSVRGWWRVLKYYVDTGVLDRAVVIATGSSTVGLLKTPERFPGRRGGGKDVVVMPLDFPAYVKIHGVDFREPAALSQLFEEYLETGGFPKAVNKHPDAQDAVIDAVVSEAYRHGKSPQLLKDILGAVVERIPSPMSYHAVHKKSEFLTTPSGSISNSSPTYTSWDWPICYPAASRNQGGKRKYFSETRSCTAPRPSGRRGGWTRRRCWSKWCKSIYSEDTARFIITGTKRKLT